MAQFITRLLVRFCLVAVILNLAACSDTIFNSKFDPFGHKTQNTADISALEGRWTDANGITSTFSNGVFESRSPDTNEKLSEGNYEFGANKIVAIEVRSLVRGKVSHVNCSLAGVKLYCTTENNQKFILTKG